MLKDSLEFNIVRSDSSYSSEINNLAQNKLRAIVNNYKESDSPTYWSNRSHYTLWEAEGLDESWVNLQYTSWGTLVNDPSASGGKAMRFSGPGTPDTIQWGPSYYQEPGDTAYPIKYTAEFRLKFHYSLFTPLGSMGPGPPDTADSICRLMVVDTKNDSILKTQKVYKGDFPGGGAGGYKTFELTDYTVIPKDSTNEWNHTEFLIVWFGIPEAKNFYIDYVKVYDENGLDLISGFKDSLIMDYVSQEWVHTTIPGTGDTVVYRWYVRDEPPSIDYFAPTRYVDSLLKQVSQERVGFQAFNYFRNPTMVHEYMLRQDPTDFCVDVYLMKWFGQDTSGDDYQDAWTNEYTARLNFVKTQADSLNKDFWLVAQAHVTCDSVYDSCAYTEIEWGDHFYCPRHRDPTSYEVRLQTFLGLCYGADAILYFRYQWWIDNNRDLVTGLYDARNDIKTEKWREIKDFTGPRMEKLGPVLNQLTWRGACSDDEVGSFILRNDSSSYIRNIVPIDHYPAYVEVGFFTDQDDDYFMLVNRRCLSTEEQNITVYIDSISLGGNRMWYVIDQYSQDTTFTGAINGAIPFTTHLDPGEGKLFKLVAFSDSAFHGTAHPLNWQGGIMVDGDVTVGSVEGHASPDSSRCATTKSFDQASL